jgi:hypothetical protein
VVSEQAALDHFFQCMSPTRSEYRKLGLELVSLEDNISRMPKKPSMVEENKNDGADDSINLLLEQALTRQRDEMMENFSHILQCLPIETVHIHQTTTLEAPLLSRYRLILIFPVFEGQIDADALDKWLNLLEGYFSVHHFSTGKRSPSHSLNLSPMSNIGGKLTGRKVPQKSLEYMGSIPLGIFLWMR